MSDLILLVNTVGSYVIFGFSLYAAAGLFALWRARNSEFKTPRRIMHDITILYLGCTVTLLFEATRVLWDSFHTEHFPIWISRIVLIVLLPMIGRSTFRLYEARRQWFR
jgi:hypothetical protein